MKCSNCGFENKNNAKFCTKCGNSLKATDSVSTTSKDNTKYVIIGLIAIIVLLLGVFGYFVYNSYNIATVESDSPDSDSSTEVDEAESSNDAGGDSDSAKTTTVSSSKSPAKEWVSIGSYSGSGSGSQTITVPAGDIKVELSAYPILNYATNHLYVDGSNGASGGVDWGPKSDVETRYDSFTYSSSSEEVFTIDFYETVSWNVEFYRYQSVIYNHLSYFFLKNY